MGRLWSVVVPSNRPDRLEGFVEAWRPVFEAHDAELFIVRDEPPWEGIPEWIPRRSDMIRSWGFYQAWASRSTYTLSLDDDVRPPENVPDPLVAYEAAFSRDWPFSPYISVGALTGTGLEMRGFPYRDRGAQAVVQYGGWDKTPDLDAATQLQHPDAEAWFQPVTLPVPADAAVTCCAMNFAFRTEWAPIMWQLPLCEGRFNRFGDIWSGLVQKRVLDAAGGVMLVNGRASVIHDRASDPFRNLEREAPGMRPNEHMWDALPQPDTSNVTDAYRQVTDALAARVAGPYEKHFLDSRDQWLNLYA